MNFHSLGGLEMRLSRILAENSQHPKLKTAKDIDMKQEKKNLLIEMCTISYFTHEESPWWVHNFDPNHSTIFPIAFLTGTF